LSTNSTPSPSDKRMQRQIWGLDVNISPTEKCDR
jgi:hypothetical protein